MIALAVSLIVIVSVIIMLARLIPDGKTLVRTTIGQSIVEATIYPRWFLGNGVEFYDNHTYKRISLFIPGAEVEIAFWRR